MNNRQVILVSRPFGTPKETNFELRNTKTSKLSKDDILVKNLFISIDPAMRSWMNEGKSYMNAVPVGGVMRALGIGVVLDSKTSYYKSGDLVAGGFNVQEVAHLPYQENVYGRQYEKITNHTLPLPSYLSALGLPGMTAYFGMLRVANLQPEQTVVISAAAGGVGGIAGQIAKIKGCRVVGITSSEQKCSHLVEKLGFDAAINYKNTTWKDELAAACPNGIDTFFDNVGGEILNTSLSFINRNAHVIINGAVSQYNSMHFMKGPANYLSLLVNRARMEGFVGMDYMHEFPKAKEEMSQWISEGKINPDVHLLEGGVDAFYSSLLAMFSGQNTGKMVLKIQDL